MYRIDEENGTVETLIHLTVFVGLRKFERDWSTLGRNLPILPFDV